MNIVPVTVGPLMTNCYLVSAPGDEQGLLIDPGADAARIAHACARAGVTPVLTVNTHAHFDHIGANPELRKRYPDMEFAVGALDADAMTCPEQNLGADFGMQTPIPAPDRRLQDGECVGCAHALFRVVHTPGHTRGSITLLDDPEAPSVVFCGDLLFADGVGRTDLPGGNTDDLRRSIRHILSLCSDETVLYPGHGPAVTAGERKQYAVF